MKDIASFDSAFISKLNEIIFANLENEHFGVNELAREIGLSRFKLNSKIYFIYRKTSNQYIRETRLIRAMEMLQQESVTAVEISLEVHLLCEPIALSKNITLELELDSSLWVNADRQMLHTVLRNLVTNALKFTYPEGVVKITTQNLDKEVLFIISDTGIGIEQMYIDKLFSIDCELSNDGTAKEKGTGLGLILCKEFVEKQHGKIWVESLLGKGSEFKFTIPTV